MSQFNFQTNDEHEAFCLEIAQAMTIFFGIMREDAIARINKQWENADLGGSDLLFRETPGYWAQWIYFGGAFWSSMDPVATTSLARIERKLNLIMDHLGLDYTDISGRVMSLLRQGKKLDAMSLYMKEVGVPLGKAKEIIEQLQSRLAQKSNTDGQ